MCNCTPNCTPLVSHLCGFCKGVGCKRHTNQCIAQLELWNERKSGKYDKKVYVLPKHLDEKVAQLHLEKIGVKLTKLSKEQAEYINVPVEGPFKPAAYRY